MAGNALSLGLLGRRLPFRRVLQRSIGQRRVRNLRQPARSKFQPEIQAVRGIRP